MVAEGLNYSIQHQAWLRVQRIGQQQTKCTTQLLNLTPIDRFMEYTQPMWQSPILFWLRDLQTTATEDIDFDADPVYDSLIGKIYPQALWYAVIGQYNDVIMDVSYLVIFLYFPFLSLRFLSFWLGSRLWDLSLDSLFWSQFGFPRSPRWVLGPVGVAPRLVIFKVSSGIDDYYQRME